MFEVGSYVTFGRYPQGAGDNPAPEPIEWLVLENNGKTALLLSKYGLDCQPFHHENKEKNWCDCDLRKWLNKEFFNSAFSDDERQRITESVIFEDNPVYGKNCGKTRDKLFCLSVEECYKYFGKVKQYRNCVFDDAVSGNRERACKATAYAMSKGAAQGKEISQDAGEKTEWWFDNCAYWLRSPGMCTEDASIVDYSGYVDIDGDNVTSDDYAVRPALRIIL